ncbi:hypothetical protein C7S18_21000 [Ahniella affigens]|uniref:Uncharacterized protein n=1 Tax=Ahniella affigens TaxID=2021234 RepID=A0A2P1PXC0_9GAMM|nr:hypothetical protein C7S18_21000 [Ahniella affigens]
MLKQRISLCRNVFNHSASAAPRGDKPYCRHPGAAGIQGNLASNVQAAVPCALFANLLQDCPGSRNPLRGFQDDDKGGPSTRALLILSG